MEWLVALRALAQPLRRLEPLAVALRQPVALRDEVADAERVDVRQRAAGPGREPPAEDRAEVRLGSRGHHALLHAARGLERLDAQQSLHHLVGGRLLRGA